MYVSKRTRKVEVTTHFATITYNLIYKIDSSNIRIREQIYSFKGISSDPCLSSTLKEVLYMSEEEETAIATKFPDNWVKEKYFYRDPQDVGEYPEAMYTVDPANFSLPPSDQGYNNWGLPDIKLKKTAGDTELKRVAGFPGGDGPPRTINSDMMDAMQMMSHKVRLANMYLGKQSPYEQYIEVLAKKKLQSVKSPEIQEACKTTLKIKVMLMESEEDCWRQFTVPASTSLAVLSDQILSSVMGWCRGYHGYMFLDTNDGAVLGPKKYSGYLDMMHVRTHFHGYMDDRKIPLAALVRNVGDQCRYVYDLGDRWYHYLVVEEVLHEGDPGFGEVALLAGHGACPPEDSCGIENQGCEGYADLLYTYKDTPEKCKKALRAASEAANYAQRGRTFSPLRFDLQYHQYDLALVLLGPKLSKPKDPMLSTFRQTATECWHCGDRLKPLKKCARCSTAMYCCRGCQTSDWPGHKAFCAEQVLKMKAENA